MAAIPEISAAINALHDKTVTVVVRETGDEHWPTHEEITAEDKAAGRIDEAKVAEHRRRMREQIKRYEKRDDCEGC